MARKASPKHSPPRIEMRTTVINNQILDSLRSKLNPPPVPHNFLPRERLRQKLDRAVKSRKLTLVCAQAGWGKTTLLGDWSNGKSKTDATAWLTTAEEENTARRFIVCFAAAINRARPGAVKDAFVLLTTAESVSDREIVATFLRELAALPGNLTVVIDDLHLIASRESNDLLAEIIEKSPRAVRFVLASRFEPTLLPLARWRARQETTELTAEDLRFTLDEIQSYFSLVANRNFSLDEIRRFNNQMEGWAAGICLAAFALRDESGKQVGLQISPDINSYVFDYLVDDLLWRESPETTDFLLVGSVLETLSAALCDEVLQTDKSVEILDYLRRANLLLPATTGKAENKFSAKESEYFAEYRLPRFLAEALRERMKSASPEKSTLR